MIRVRPLAYLKRDRSVEMPLVVSVDPHPTHPIRERLSSAVNRVSESDRSTR